MQNIQTKSWKFLGWKILKGPSIKIVIGFVALHMIDLNFRTRYKTQTAQARTFEISVGSLYCKGCECIVCKHLVRRYFQMRMACQCKQNSPVGYSTFTSPGQNHEVRLSWSQEKTPPLSERCFISMGCRCILHIQHIHTTVKEWLINTMTNSLQTLH